MIEIILKFDNVSDAQAALEKLGIDDAPVKKKKAPVKKTEEDDDDDDEEDAPPTKTKKPVKTKPEPEEEEDGADEDEEDDEETKRTEIKQKCSAFAKKKEGNKDKIKDLLNTKFKIGSIDDLPVAKFDKFLTALVALK